jgi:2'-5' RNA ligase
MRLFTAINFNKDIKDKIWKAVSLLKEESISGNFTLYDNLHLTLIFLGEIRESAMGDIKKIIDNIESSSFTLTINGVGKFKRAGGDIFFLSLQKSQELIRLHSELMNLRSLGIFVEEREYTPHLTLGREVVMKNGFDTEKFIKEIPEITVEVKSVELMKSERIKGVLTYTPVYSKALR